MLHQKKDKTIKNLFIVVSLAFALITAGIVFLPPSLHLSAEPTKIKPLPKIKSMTHLQELLAAETHYFRTFEAIDGASPPVQDTTKAEVQADIGINDAESINGGFSSTNVQVAGVDEADMVKTDGTYIYQCTNKEVIITQAVPADKMKIAARIKYDDPAFSPQEMFITDKYLVLIGSKTAEYYAHNSDNTATEDATDIRIVNPYKALEPVTSTLIYDISSPGQINKVREIDLSGSYSTSRRIEQSVYLVINQYIGYYPYNSHIIDNAIPTPSYRDSAGGNMEWIPTHYEDISYFPECIYSSYIIIAGFNLDKIQEKAAVDVYLGNADNVYASPNNLYVAVPPTYYKKPIIMDSVAPETSTASTDIYRFGLDKGQVIYNGQGQVPGTVLNQFSLDEYEGYLRVATTTGDLWGTGSSISQNHVYILDPQLEPAGSIQNIAPGEKIYSARFMGPRAFMVTFRQIDPFFVLDLKNPADPKVLGQLKIPGYSDYLHPYDENHILGFGKDTVEGKSWSGSTSQAYYQGMKISLFDISDVTTPIEMDKAIIGSRGTESELLHNHKALLFDQNKNLLAFPVTVMELDTAGYDQEEITTAYGQFAFQGAYVYNIDLAEGLIMKGRITHLDADDMRKAGDYWYDSEKNIRRIMYIGNNLYTISASQVQAHHISDLHLVGKLIYQTD